MHTLDPFLKSRQPDPDSVVKSAPATLVEKAWSDAAREAAAEARSMKSHLNEHGFKHLVGPDETGEPNLHGYRSGEHDVYVNSKTGAWAHDSNKTGENIASGKGLASLKGHLGN
jgi:hypothetical protein